MNLGDRRGVDQVELLRSLAASQHSWGGPRVKLSVLVPVYNGAPYLERCIDQLANRLVGKPYAWEVIVCEDGSTDGTKQLCAVLKERYPSIRFISEDLRLGRGGALRRSFQAASGDVLAYVDVDMATDPRFIDGLVNAVRDGADVATGSRYLAQSQARRKFGRQVMSLVYNNLARLLFSSRVRDHQCGFKAFKRSVLDLILPTVKSNHWFWDTELLIRAQAMGYRIDEIPIHWSETVEGSTLDLGRDVLLFLKEMVRLKIDLTNHLSAGSVTAHPVSSEPPIPWTR